MSDMKAAEKKIENNEKKIKLFPQNADKVIMSDKTRRNEMKTNRQIQQEAATKSFEKSMDEMAQSMQRIADRMAEMRAKAEEIGGLNWAHAGTASHVARELKEIEEIFVK